MREQRGKLALLFLAGTVALGLIALVWATGVGEWKATSGGALDDEIASNDAASTCGQDAFGMANPAAVYCRELGYEYQVVDTAGGQDGICVLPSGRSCGGWSFLEGSCGGSYSYCARHGYGWTTKTDGKNPFSRTYSVCVRGQQDVGAATDLMGLSEKTTKGSVPVAQSPAAPAEGGSVGSPPSSFDWRNYNGQDWMTPVKNQASCGSCWAFSAVGVVEAVHNIATGNPSLDLNLSEQQLVSNGSVCCTSCGDCGGGWTGSALWYIRDTGVADEACFPYTATNATCALCGDWQSRLVTIDAYGGVSSSPSQIKQSLIDKGPLSVAMGIGSWLDDEDQEQGGYWDGDVYRCTDDSYANHAVVIAGYNDAGGYWIIKNSWGTGWPYDWRNDGGYFKVGYGECAIEDWVYYADPGPPPGQYELTMQVSPAGGGTTVPSVGDHWYDSGSSVNVSASAFDFGHWSGDCSGTSPVSSVYMDSNKTCTANFCHEGCTCHPSTDTPKAIPDVATINSSINVPDDFNIDDVNVTLNITHTYDGDLSVYLISPQGTRVELFTSVGGAGDNFANTVLDDNCATPITGGAAPFTGCYQPEGSLSDFDGENSSGVWTLEVTDAWQQDTGDLEWWSLELCGEAEPDSDADGVSDDLDNCPQTSNPGQGDYDGDGVPGSQPPPGATWGGDACDNDDDNDTVPDGEDADPLYEFVCQDLDADTCDDCSVLGQADVSQDGTDTDSDGACDAGDPDDDNDGFDDDVESYVGTDPLDDCPDGPGDDAWPFDVNVDTWSNILDVLLYKGQVHCEVGDLCYNPRLDLNVDSWVNILDVLLYKGNLHVQCTNP
jgi:subtilisin-like proprotein convertase family protein/C1A family cysteine protease/putative hemolysin